MSDLFAALDATWPAAATHRAGPWLVNEGRGGGKRVSAAVAVAPGAEDQIALAEAKQAELGQPGLFCLRGAGEPLDQALAQRGYRIIDPVSLYQAPATVVAAEPPARMSTFPIWPPLAIMTEIWAEGDIGPGRLAVMARAQGAKTSILGRAGDRCGGAAFVALHGATAVVHALHVHGDMRRQGLARNLMRAAALWAGDQGADTIALAVTDANAPANALYRQLGMTVAGQYHYRLK